MPGIFTYTKEEISHAIYSYRLFLILFQKQMEPNNNRLSFQILIRWTLWISICVRQHSRRHSIFHVNMKGLAPFLPTHTRMYPAVLLFPPRFVSSSLPVAHVARCVMHISVVICVGHPRTSESVYEQRL